MKLRLLLKRGVLAFGLALSLVLQATSSVLAGTTGSLSGIVVDATSHKPVAGAQVTATSPSQTVKATTDDNGRFGFLSLPPDTYTVSVAPSSTNDATNVSGVTVQADQAVQTTLAAPGKLKTIGSVTSRAASSLVKPGTTADVYSIGAVQQDKASQVGGGGTLNSAWSAISTVPGVFVAPNQNGYIGAGPSLSIRGGDYDQIGYELDGIPVNRSFDNYPSTSLSSLGQQEVQVYTGATPANAEAPGLSGFVNQVIKTGTSPAYQQFSVADGGPAYYHKATIEVGGANPSRTFSYYVGLGGYNQTYRYGDQYNSASIDGTYGTPLESCAAVPAAAFNPQTVPSCFAPNGKPYQTTIGNPDAYGLSGPYVLGPYQIDDQSQTQQRDSIFNFHFGFPRKDGNKDDLQLLLDINHLSNLGYTSANDEGGAAYLNAIGVGAPFYLDGFQAVKPYGSLLPTGYAGGGANVVAPYYFPSSGTTRPTDQNLPPDLEDSFTNNQNIFKAQYTHSFGSNAFFRLYGYTYYSDWLENGPSSTLQNYVGYSSTDYELNSHTRGLSASFTDQLNDKNLLSLEGSYTTANVTRYNNSGVGFGDGTTIGYLVDGANPYSGVCYTSTGVAVPGCRYNANGTAYQTLTIGNVLNNTAVVPAAGTTCGGGPCQYEIVSGGPSATYNQVKPKFTSVALTDDFRPTSKLDLNFGIRYDLFAFNGANTFNSGARTLFYNAYNSQAAANGTTPLPFDPSGAGNTLAFPVFQPRFGLTYSVDPNTVLRASYGRYAQAPNTAYEQYNYLQPNDLSKLIAFGENGLPTTPGHVVLPPTSNNYDASIEHQFAQGFAVKASPFFRKTQDQIQNFYLDQRTGFVSGLNVGQQTSEGLELEVDKGDFSRNGFASKLSFTYTNSYIQYTKAPNGESVVDPINAAITQFNGYTKAGGGFKYYSVADGATGTPGVGSNVGGAGFVANPYYNAPLQALLGENDKFPTFDTFPGGIGSVASTYGAPYVATLLLQYKHGPLTITPALQFNAGQRYGTPENTPGIAPDMVTGVLPGSPATDPRYNYGSPGAGGSPYDASTALTTIPVPDIYTKKFDALGAFVQPSFLQMNLQVAYDLTKRVSIVTTLANVYTSYFGGSKTGFTVPGAQGYGLIAGAGAGINPVGNVYNPGTPVQPFLTAPYEPGFAGLPFGVFVEARIKI